MSENRLEVAERHRAAASTFSARVAKVTDWTVPTPVPEWQARDIVRHLVLWSRSMFGSAPGVSFSPIPDVDSDPVAAWEAHNEQMQALLDNPALDRIELSDEHFGTQPLVDAIANFYVPDVFMHTWDLAISSGQQSGLDNATCAAMLEGMEKQEEMLRASGQFGERQPVRDDASSEERLMAFIGRDPYWTPPAA